MRIDAVTFDYWNTIAYEPTGYMSGLRRAAWERVFAREGIDLDSAAIGAAFRAAWEAVNDVWEAGGTPRHGPEAAAHAIELLDLRPSASLRAELIESFVRASDGADLLLAGGIEECLRGLRAQGVRLGIVCDVGLTPSTALRAFLDRAGILEHFDSWAFSDEVGAYKPAPVMFERALAPLGVAPDRAAHVGDRRRTDVAGARAFGMRAVRYAGVYDDVDPAWPEGDLVATEHASLAGALGLEDPVASAEGQA